MNELDVKDITGDRRRHRKWPLSSGRIPHAKVHWHAADGRARPTGQGAKGRDATLLLILNAHDDVVNFHLPEVTSGRALAAAAGYP